MCNKGIKSNLLMAWLVGATFCCTVTVVLAGPLDRGEMQPRNNPAASSMIRVPGVLGQSERSALEILQRAGLNVNTRYIRQSTEKYAGRSGMVVKQTPSAGGIAMLGSSVTIMIYKVEDKSIDESDGGYGGPGGGYDDADGGTENARGGYDNADGGYGNAGGYDNAGGGTGNAGGGYDNTGGGYGNVGGGYKGNTGGSYNDNAGGASGDDTGYSGKGYSTDKAAADDSASGQDWGSSPGSNPRERLK
ncbi:hypothetical protein MNBD_GAMMA24-2614 [hydrothermal vent metagenome]|uniref:PASTA domain-containing protein n=1 Tax=hydrothermal vent metagenome TaxID=652676 RepID=A0A3B1C7M7_9ZZZZ